MNAYHRRGGGDRRAHRKSPPGNAAATAFARWRITPLRKRAIACARRVALNINARSLHAPSSTYALHLILPYSPRQRRRDAVPAPRTARSGAV